MNTAFRRKRLSATLWSRAAPRSLTAREAFFKLLAFFPLAFWSEQVPNIPAGSTLVISNNTSTPSSVAGTTYTGAGTLQKTGAGVISFGGNGQINVSLSMGGLVDVEGGTLRGSSSFQSSFAANMASLKIAAGATFDGVEGAILVDALTGAGTLQGGYGNSTGGTTIGVAGGSGTFSGTIQNGAYGVMALTKTGAGNETLTGTNTYTGGTTITGGTLTILDNGSALSSGQVNIISQSNAALILDNDQSASRLFLKGTTLSGTGSVAIEKTGAGEFDFGNNGGTVNVALPYQGVIYVAAGTLGGSAAYQANWSNNSGALYIASGAAFNGAEGNIVIGGLGGSGTLTGGFRGSGSTTIVAGGAGYSAFSGAIKDSAYGALSLTISGTKETLTGSNTYTGGTTIKNGGILQLGDGTTTTSIVGNATDGGTLAFDEASGTPLTFGGVITDGSQAGFVAQYGGTTLLTATNTYTGGTLISGGTLTALDNSSTLSSGSVAISSGASLNFDFDQSGSRSFLKGTTLSGAGTIEKTGAGELDFGNNGGKVSVDMAAGGTIDVAAGTLGGSAAFQGDWTQNLGALTIESGAIFDGEEGNIVVDALNGAGTLKGGYANGGSTTIGVAGGSGTFTGVIANSSNGKLALTKVGAGTETLSGTDTYTGGTTISGGTLTITNGSALSNGPIVINSGATLNLDSTSGRQFLQGTTLTGTGTIQVTGFGETDFGNNGGTVTIALGKGAMIDVGSGGTPFYDGKLGGSAAFQANWTNNQAGLYLALGSTFNGAEGKIVVDGLTGQGILEGGYNGAGSTTIGVAGGSGTFGGVIEDSQYGALSLMKAGAGTETLQDGSLGTSSYTGGTTITGGTLELVTATAAGKGAITFANTSAAATLQIDAQAETEVGSSSTYTFANQINGATSKNRFIDLRGLAFNTQQAGANTATFANGVLSVSNGSQTVNLHVGNAAGSTFTTMSDGNGGTSVVDPPAAGTAYATPDLSSSQISIVCFAAGTAIRTASGEKPVEHLAVGDLVVTASGPTCPIRWLGHRKIDCRRHPQPNEVLPVRIAAHAFGEGRPSRDLVVSPGHAICVDISGEVLIPALALVNGTTITRDAVDTITYWHVELDGHDLLLAENLPTESYLEMGNRGFFLDAAAVVLAAAPDAPAATHADFCRPFHACGPVVDAARARLNARTLPVRQHRNGAAPSRMTSA